MELNIKTLHGLYENSDYDDGGNEALAKYLNDCSDVEGWDFDDEVLVVYTDYNACIRLTNTRN